MRHPFAGVIGTQNLAADETPALEKIQSSRRGFFGFLAASVGVAATGALGLVGLSSQAEAQITTQALGEEGGRAPFRPRPPRQAVTTQALGEEGGGRTSSRFLEQGGRPPQQVSTQAFGEEGGRMRQRPRRSGWKSWKN